MIGGNRKYVVGNVTFAQIIRKARTRDEEALTALYLHAAPTMYRYVNGRLRRPDLVEDVVSEVFLDMVEAIGNLRSEQEAGFFAWLYQIAQGKISRALKGVTASERRLEPLSTPVSGEDRPAVEPKATDPGGG
jgi:DNA-directed RNA polymerase specialized sigma24 family protein